MALTVTITNAGRAELINAQNTGTNAAVINSVGVSSVHAAGDLKLLTTLPNERKRLNTIGGEVVADDVIHVTINDTTADTYTLRAFGVYFESGTLFAVCTSVDPIMEKAAAAMLLQAVDITLTTLDTASIEFGGTGFTNPPATTERMGVVELATVDETIAGTDAVRAVTPYGLARALVSWAQNFAAKVHGHVIADIAGLSDSLASKANRNHVHGADDVNSGVFHIDRIPKLAISWINGLADQLAGLAAKDHKHAASDITSGQLHLDRLPAIPQSKVSGLVDAIATLTTAVAAKAEAALSVVMRGSLGSLDLNTVLTPGGYRQAANANAQLQLNYPITNDGGSLLVVNPSTDTGYQTYHSRTTNRMWTRPFLAGSFYPWAEHWTSANFDPAVKADLAGATFNGPLGVARRGANAIFTIDGDSGRVRQIIWQTGGVARWILQADETAEGGNNVGSDLVLMNRNDAGGFMSQPVRVKRETGEFQFARRPVWAGATPWDNGNLPDPVRIGITNTFTRNQIIETASQPDVLTLRRGNNGANWIVFENTDGVTRLGIISGNLRFQAQSGTSYEVYHAGNFDPAAKANVASPALMGNPTAPTQAAGNNSTRLATTAFVQREISDIPTPGNATTSTRGLALLATSAQTQAGTDGSRAITPAALWSFAKSIGVNGYAQVPGTPLVIQWGRQTGAMSEGQRTVMLPVAFGGGCVAMLANPWNSSPTADYYMQIVGRYLDRLVFMLNSASGSSGSAQGFDWLAVGFATGTADPAYSTGGGGGGGGLPPGGGGGGEEPIIRPEV